MTEHPYRTPSLLGVAIVPVTGAGQGNGTAIAAGVAEAGARVIVIEVRRDTAEATTAEIRFDSGEERRFLEDGGLAVFIGLLFGLGAFSRQAWGRLRGPEAVAAAG
jgi:NAD(P)-dependent dehydrogenase (short-subunit alcohol dehydrogenase family)